jgi:hypothetical protein
MRMGDALMSKISIPLDGLGMQEAAMRELVNRMNKYDDRKWVFVKCGGVEFNQMANPIMGLMAQMYNSLAA